MPSFRYVGWAVSQRDSQADRRTPVRGGLHRQRATQYRSALGHAEDAKAMRVARLMRRREASTIVGDR